MTDVVRSPSEFLEYLYPNNNSYANPEATVFQSQLARDLIVSIGSTFAPFIIVDGVNYAQTEAGINAAILAASLAGSGDSQMVFVPGGLGPIAYSSGVVPKNNVYLVLGTGTWLQAPTGATNAKLISHTGTLGIPTSLLAQATPEGIMTTALVTGGVAALGLTEGGYAVISTTVATNETKFCFNRVRFIRGDVIYWYMPLPFAYTTADIVRAVVSPLDNFSFTGELRGTGNTGTCYGAHLQVAVNCNFINVKAQDFAGSDSLGTQNAMAVGITYGYNVNFTNCVAQNSGSLSVGAFHMNGVTNYNVSGCYVSAPMDVDTVRVNTAQAGGASTITLDAAASGSDNFYNGNLVYIAAGTGAGQTREISGYVGATKVATVSLAWGTVPDATSIFVVFLSDNEGIGFGFDWRYSHYGNECNNTVAAGDGRPYKHTSCTYISTTNIQMYGAGYSTAAFTSDTWTGSCAHCSAYGTRVSGSQGSGLWLTSDATGSPSDMKFTDCDYRNSSIATRAVATNSEVRIDAGTKDVTLNNCHFSEIVDAGTGTVIDGYFKTFTQADAINTVTKTSLFSMTVTGYRLAQFRGIEIEIPILITNASAANRTIIFGLEYDNTVMWACVSIALPSDAAARGGMVKATFLSRSYVLQTGFIQVGINDPGGGSVAGSGDISAAPTLPTATGMGSGAEDSTTDKVLAITVTNSNADFSVQFWPNATARLIL